MGHHVIYTEIAQMRGRADERNAFWDGKGIYEYIGGFSADFLCLNMEERRDHNTWSIPGVRKESKENKKVNPPSGSS